MSARRWQWWVLAAAWALRAAGEWNQTTGAAAGAGESNQTTGEWNQTTGGASATPAPTIFVTRNVTLRGLAIGRAGLTLPAGWGWAWAAAAVIEAAFGVCPAGRYCPAGAGAPRPCPLGTYSPGTGRAGLCQQPCGANRYCPDPAAEYACPAHTTSAVGSTSQLDCGCDQGYQCAYRKQVNLNVVVPMALGAWNADPGARAALVGAVAAAGGVGVGGVAIESVAPIVGGGRRARMRTLPGTEIQIVVRGAERLTGLDQRLRLCGHPALRRAETRWQRAHQIRVARSGPG